MLLDDTNGALKKAADTGDPKILNYYSTIANNIKNITDTELAKYDDATLKTDYHKVLDNIYAQIDDATRRGSDTIEEKIDTEIDKSKYDNLSRLQKLHYGFSYGMQETSEAMQNSRDWQEKNLPATANTKSAAYVP